MLRRTKAPIFLDFIFSFRQIVDRIPLAQSLGGKTVFSSQLLRECVGHEAE